MNRTLYSLTTYIVCISVCLGLGVTTVSASGSSHPEYTCPVSYETVSDMVRRHTDTLSLGSVPSYDPGLLTQQVLDSAQMLQMKSYSQISYHVYTLARIWHDTRSLDTGIKTYSQEDVDCIDALVQRADYAGVRIPSLIGSLLALCMQYIEENKKAQASDSEEDKGVQFPLHWGNYIRLCSSLIKTLPTYECLAYKQPLDTAHYAIYGDDISLIIPSSSGRYIASATKNGFINLYYCERDIMMFAQSYSSSPIIDIQFTPDETYVLMLHKFGGVKVCNIQSGDLKKPPIPSALDSDVPLACSPCSTFFAIRVVLIGHSIDVYEFDSLQRCKTLTATDKVTSIAWSPCSTLLACIQREQSPDVRDNDKESLWLYDLQGDELFGKSITHATWTRHRGGCRSLLAWSPCGRYIAVYGKDATVAVYQLAGRSEQNVRNAILVPTASLTHESHLTDVQYSPCGRYLSGMCGENVHIYDAHTFKLKKKIPTKHLWARMKFLEDMPCMLLMNDAGCVFLYDIEHDTMHLHNTVRYNLHDNTVFGGRAGFVSAHKRNPYDMRIYMLQELYSLHRARDISDTILEHVDS